MNGHSGGGERYKYYLSETLWSDHTIEESKDLADDGRYDWEHYYLTGKDYDLTGKDYDLTGKDYE